MKIVADVADEGKVVRATHTALSGARRTFAVLEPQANGCVTFDFVGAPAGSASRWRRSTTRATGPLRPAPP
ncbi:MAG TPA: hypothetical protein VGB18_03300 [Candidatus Thermoplasmatota archaeon]